MMLHVAPIPVVLTSAEARLREEGIRGDLLGGMAPWTLRRMWAKLPFRRPASPPTGMPVTGRHLRAWGSRAEVDFSTPTPMTPAFISRLTSWSRSPRAVRG